MFGASTEMTLGWYLVDIEFLDSYFGPRVEFLLG
jgi:hypothetical protein